MTVRHSLGASVLGRIICVNGHEAAWPWNVAVHAWISTQARKIRHGLTLITHRKGPGCPAGESTVRPQSDVNRGRRCRCDCVRRRQSPELVATLGSIHSPVTHL
jgi:hypothetical protein